MPGATSDVWEAMSTARTIRRFTDEPVDDATLQRCLQAAMWAPSGANAQAWRFVVLRSAEQRAVVAEAAARALEVIEPVYAGPPPTTTAGTPAPTGRPTSCTTGPVSSRQSCSRRSTFQRHPNFCWVGRSSRRCRTSCWPHGLRD